MGGNLNISYNCNWYLLSPLAHSGVVLSPFGFTIPCWFSWLYIHFSKYCGLLIKFVSLNPFKCDIFLLLGSWPLYSNVMSSRHVFLFCHSIGIATKPENENQYSLKRSFRYKNDPPWNLLWQLCPIKKKKENILLGRFTLKEFLLHRLQNQIHWWVWGFLVELPSTCITMYTKSISISSRFAESSYIKRKIAFGTKR